MSQGQEFRVGLNIIRKKQPVQNFAPGSVIYFHIGGGGLQKNGS